MQRQTTALQCIGAAGRDKLRNYDGDNICGGAACGIVTGLQTVHICCTQTDDCPAATSARHISVIRQRTGSHVRSEFTDQKLQPIPYCTILYLVCCVLTRTGPICGAARTPVLPT